nr:immunoglobulin heavy chain junction region [Mus musculus]
CARGPGLDFDYW